MTDAVARAGRSAPALLLGLAGIVALWSQLELIDRSLWFDELVSVQKYILPGPTAPFRDYVPNDHLLFELLAWLTTNISGDFSEAAYRAWSVFPALGALALLTRWAWLRLGPWEAAIFAGLVASSPLYLLLGSEARGYGFAFLAAAVMFIYADRLRARVTRRSLAWVIAAATAGVWTLPTFILPFLGVAAVLACKPMLRRYMLIAVLTVGALTLIFYAPVLGGVLSASSQQFGKQLPWDGFVQAPVADLIDPSATLWLPNVTLGVRELLVGMVLAAGTAVLWYRREHVVPLLLVVPTVLTYLVLEIGRFYVSVRFGSFLLMPLMLLGAVALAAICRVPSRYGLLRVAGVGVALAFSLFALNRFDHFFESTRDVPIENYKEVAALVGQSGISLVVTNSERPEGFVYYLGEDHRLHVETAAALEAMFCRQQGPFVYVEDNLKGSLPDLACLVARGAVSVSVPQLRAAVRVVFVYGPTPAKPPLSVVSTSGAPRTVPDYPLRLPYRALLERLLN